MPADDLVLNVRQIAGYPPVASAPPAGFLVLQIAGLGSAYASISPANLVGTALAQGGDMAIAGQLLAASISAGSATFSNAAVNLFSAQQASLVELCASFASINGVPVATQNDLAALAGSSVRQFNGRVGNVSLWIDDIICAGGAPIASPRFQGEPRAPTPPPWSNSNRLATTAYVMTALGVAFDGYAPLDSPNFTGIPTGPTAAVGSSDGQLATTAFVQNAVTESTTGVSSFNSRTGAVILLAADVTSVGGALLASPAFTGVPIAPTATPGTSSTQLATCAFVSAAVAAVAGGVSSFNGRTGAVDLTAADVAAVAVGTFNGRAGTVQLLGNDISAAGGALLAGPAFSGAPTAPTAALGTTTTQLATTAFVQAAVASVTAGVSSFNTRTGAVTLTAPDISAVGGALLAGPTFTGIPTAPTATLGTSSAQLATCAFVAAAVSAGTAGVASFNSRTGAVTLLVADISGAGGALIASPAFTGLPTAPTATPGSLSTAQLATCAFVQSALPLASTAAPLMNGTAAAGSATAWSRGDHVHPSDTSRLALTGGILSGNLQVNGAGGIVSTGLSITGASGGIGAASITATGGMTSPGYTVTSSGVNLNANGLTVDGATWIALAWNSAFNFLNLAINGGNIGNLVYSPPNSAGTNYVTTLSSVPTDGYAYIIVPAFSTGTWLTFDITTSDRRIKSNLVPAGDALDRINAIPVYTGDQVNPTTRQYERHLDYTILAQEVEDVLPSAYRPPMPTPETGLASLSTLSLVTTLWRGVQQLSERLAALETARA